MQINVTCSTIEELLNFAQAILGTGEVQAPIASLEIRPDVPAAESLQAPQAAMEPVAAAPTAPQPAPLQQQVIPATPVQQAAPATPVQQTAQTMEGQPQQVPTCTTSYTLDDLARAAMTLMDSGRQADLLRMLQDFGVESLPALPQGKYGAFATALRGLGAQI